MTSIPKRKVGIVVFDDVEVLDFAGPFEVFSRTRLEPGVASRLSTTTAPFDVFLVAGRSDVIRATGNLSFLPHCDFATAPRADVLVVPGGFGTRALLGQDHFIGSVRRMAEEADVVCSVCTGALLLAKASVLRGRRATTHWGAYDTLSGIDETITVDRTTRIVDDRVITSAGISAGIDMALYVVERFHGAGVADETARYMEYRR